MDINLTGQLWGIPLNLMGQISQGATIPTWIPLIGGIPINSPMVGSFFGIVISVCIAKYNTDRAVESNKRYIEAIDRASSNQIIEARNLRNLKRKQSLKSLIEELDLNINFYDDVLDALAQENYRRWYLDFQFDIIEKCLVDTPIDDDRINGNLIKFYHLLKTSQNYLIATRTATNHEFIRLANIKIAVNYMKNEDIFELIRTDLVGYEIENRCEHKPAIPEARGRGDQEKGWWQFWR